MITRLVSILALAACSGSGTAVRDATPLADATNESPADAAIGCQAAITAPPAELGLDPFYAQYLDAGLPIVASARVQPAALPIVCRTVAFMLAHRPEVAAKLREIRVRVGIMAVSEVTTDMPEHSDLNTAFPETNWDERARGLGATVARPLSSCAEENVLRLSRDPYAGENILVHEFGHTVWLGVELLPDAAALSALQASFDAAVAAGTFANTYAASSVPEYFAEGVQSYFDVNLEAIPANGIHNAINTRVELTAADPTLAGLIADLFGDAALPDL